MRSSKFFLTVAAIVVALCAVSTSQAQVTIDKNRSYFSPDQQFGFGVNNAGGHIQYALGPAFHLGVNLRLDFQKYQDIESETAYDFGPYAKFLFSGDVIKPYAQASLGIIKPNTGSANVIKDSGVVVNLPETQMRIVLALGAEHFFNQNVGIYGHVNLVDMTVTEPTFTGFGLQGGIAGVEFFF